MFGYSFIKSKKRFDKLLLNKITFAKQRFAFKKVSCTGC